MLYQVLIQHQTYCNIYCNVVNLSLSNIKFNIFPILVAESYQLCTCCYFEILWSSFCGEAQLETHQVVAPCQCYICRNACIRHVQVGGYIYMLRTYIVPSYKSISMNQVLDLIRIRVFATTIFTQQYNECMHPDINFLVNLFSLKFINIAMVTILKNVTNILTAFGELYIFRKRQNQKVWTAMFLMVHCILYQLFELFQIVR